MQEPRHIEKHERSRCEVSGEKPPGRVPALMWRVISKLKELQKGQLFHNGRNGRETKACIQVPHCFRFYTASDSAHGVLGRVQGTVSNPDRMQFSLPRGANL